MSSTDRPRPPSVERVLAAARPGAGERDAEAVLAVAREVVAAERARLADGEAPRSVATLGAAVLARLEGFDGPAGDATRGSAAGEATWGSAATWVAAAGGGGSAESGGQAAGLARVLNATGVVVHTNLGRAAWPRVAIEAARRAADGAVLLELDRATGRRGKRYGAAEEHLVALTGAEDALVVTNNAAAVALAVGLAGRGGGVAVSRGELVEIGGGVRIPEILRRAGVRLIEVGATNRTRVGDFAAALADPTSRIRAVLRVHLSNFVQAGFVEAPDPAALAELAHRHGAVVLDDLGSGALLPTERLGLAHEPMPRERLAAGADLVTFSGDKLVGGPQAGLIVGRADLVTRLRRDPLARAMRPDKTILAAVAATLALYRGGRAMAEIPIWRMLAAPVAELRGRAAALLSTLPDGAGGVVELEGTVGGGSVPGETIPSAGIALAVPRGRAATELLDRLRIADPCVVGRIDHDRVVLDLRTVAPGDDGALADAVRRAIPPTSAR